MLLPILKLTHLAFLHTSSDFFFLFSFSFFDIPRLWPLLNKLLFVKDVVLPVCHPQHRVISGSGWRTAQTLSLSNKMLVDFSSV